MYVDIIKLGKCTCSQVFQFLVSNISILFWIVFDHIHPGYAPKQTQNTKEIENPLPPEVLGQKARHRKS